MRTRTVVEKLVCPCGFPVGEDGNHAEHRQWGIRRAHKEDQSHNTQTQAIVTQATAQIWWSGRLKPVGAGGAEVGVEGSQMPAGKWECGARKSPKLERGMCHVPPQSVGGATWHVEAVVGN